MPCPSFWPSMVSVDPCSTAEAVLQLTMKADDNRQKCGCPYQHAWDDGSQTGGIDLPPHHQRPMPPMSHSRPWDLFNLIETAYQDYRAAQTTAKTVRGSEVVSLAEPRAEARFGVDAAYKLSKK